MSEFMPSIHLFKEGKRVGELSLDKSGPVSFILPPSLSDETRQDILRVYGDIKGVKWERGKAIKEKYRASGYDALEADEITDPALRYQLEEKEATPLQKREAAFIHESNLIENITEIPRDQILDSLVNDKVGGHVSAWRYARALAENCLPLKPEHVCAMQKLLTDEQSKYDRHFLEKKYRGKLRDCPVFIGGNMKLPISEQKFTAFFEKLNKNMAAISRNDLDAILRLAAQSHLEYEEGLHPFADGNGRSGRLIINYILAFFGYPPLVLTSHDKNDYYKCFATHNVNATGAMEKYFLSKYRESSI